MVSGEKLRRGHGSTSRREPEELNGVGDDKVHGNYLRSSDLRDVGCSIIAGVR
jgi:hypothetical protein